MKKTKYQKARDDFAKELLDALDNIDPAQYDDKETKILMLVILTSMKIFIRNLRDLKRK